MNKVNPLIIRLLVFIILNCFCYLGFSQTNTKRLDSLYGIANSVLDVDSSNKLLENILIQTRAAHYNKGTVKLLLLKNRNYYNIGNFDESLKISYQIEDEVKEIGNSEQISSLFAVRANCYLNLLFFEKSKQCLDEAQFYAEKIKENDDRYYSLGRVYRLRASYYRKSSKPNQQLDSIMHYARKSYNVQLLIKNNPYKPGLVIDSYILGELFLDKDNVDSAEHYFLISKAYAKDLKLDKLGQESLIGLGMIHEKKNNIDSALFYFNQALKIALKSKRVGNIKNCYQHLSSLYDKKGNDDKSREFAQKFAFITDSIAQANKSASSATAGYIIKDNEIKYSNNKKQYMLIIISSVCFLIGAMFLIFKSKKKYSNTLLLKDEEQKLLNQKLNDLQVDKLDDAGLKDLVSLIKSNDPAFFEKFKQHFPVFIQKLIDQSPDMLASDMDVCAKLRLGFNTKEIAYFSRSSVRAVESRKYRIRKKLGLTADDDLATWVANL